MSVCSHRWAEGYDEDTGGIYYIRFTGSGQQAGVLVQPHQEADVETGLEVQGIWGMCLEGNEEGAEKCWESSQSGKSDLGRRKESGKVG